MKKRTATVLKWAGIVVLAMGVLYAVLLGFANRSLRRAYATLEAGGRPMKAQQIILADIPNSDNAALIYKAVVLQLKAEEAGEQDLFEELGDLASRIRAEKPDAEAEEQFRAICQRKVVQDAIAMLRRGASKAGCRYDLDYSKGARILLPHIADLRTLSRILCAKARMEVAQGRGEEAWGDVITSLRLANALHSEPLLISQLVRIAQFSLAADTIPSVAAIAAPDQQQCDAIAELLLSFEDTAPLVAAMDGERLLLGEWAFNLPRSELRKTVVLVNGGAKHVIALGTIFPPLLHRDHAAYLTVMHAYATNATGRYSSSDVALGDELLNEVPRYCILTRMLVPALSAAKGRYVSMIAQARVTRAGLAVMQHVTNENAYPANLEALRTGNLVDPFTGGALAYKTTPSGFVVYSVGENLTDDGGTTAKDRRDGDIVWNYCAKKTADRNRTSPHGEALPPHRAYGSRTRRVGW